ncbi:PQQ-dependent sugar dehydrogenase [Marinobacter salicampi]|uniref:PQQ-dependent sugar dehydrogenase n=1 Tax=Marinobacter salicampi TaxID=435907 RepID=UPI001407C465|nr:PQQ-dependent sugar dehydrogenase [Marinobacter salicampi]
MNVSPILARKNRARALLAAASAAFIAALPVATQAETLESQYHDFEVTTVVDGLEHPWAMAFLPDGDKLITERAGRLRLLKKNGELVDEPIKGLPEMAVAGQGGLLDIVLHPDFEENHLLVLSYAHRNDEGLTTRYAKARFEEDELQDVEVIFEALPRSDSGQHFAGRIAFDQDKSLYVTVGDRGEMQRAQDTGDDAGGVHHITLDGEPAPSNPWLDDPEINDTFFTYGNRNIQGMTRHPETGVIWSHEHGPRGGDEINIIRGGTNYGWPEVTHGISYGGEPISDRTDKPGISAPLHYWDPSIAPSGMDFYTGEQFPEWQGDLFVGALKFQKLVRLRINDELELVEEEDLLADQGHRIRAVYDGPEGAIWLLTDSSDGKVLKLTSP